MFVKPFKKKVDIEDLKEFYLGVFTKVALPEIINTELSFQIKQ